MGRGSGASWKVPSDLSHRIRASGYTDAVEPDVHSRARSAHYDPLVEELRVLRESRAVSYRELAARITRQREQDGAQPATARIAHTTVSDVFRSGRARLNAELVAEIVRALGYDSDTADAWRGRVARRGSTGLASRPAPALAELDALHTPPSRRTSFVTMVVFVAGGLFLNATGKFFNPLLGDIFFVDMVGTATVALVGGPWLAALVGALFVVVELLKFQVGGALFAVTMIFAGLIWGYGARHAWGGTLRRFLGLSAVVAVATSALAVPITMVYYDGNVGRGLDVFVAGLQESGLAGWTAVGALNLSVSLLDKVLTGAIAFMIARLIWSLPGAAEQGLTPPRTHFPR